MFRQVGITPDPPGYDTGDIGPQPIAYTVTVKSTPHNDDPHEHEMYNVTDDPMELTNLYNDGIHGAQQTLLAELLMQQRCAKRLVPQSGNVPGQPTC